MNERVATTFGAAKRAITPALGSELSGYPFVTRLATAVHDDLFATAIVIGEGSDRAALIFLDLIAAGADLVSKSRNLIAELTGIDPRRVLISVTHTHSGPSMHIGDLFDEGVIGSPDRRYVDGLPQIIADVTAEAAANVRPGSIGFAWTEPREAIGGNRRREDGPSDPAISVVALFDADGGPAALIVSVAVHPTILQAENLEVTGDLAWGVRAGIGRRMGTNVIVGYATGAAGDQSTRRTRRAATFDEAERLGDVAAEAVERAVADLKKIPVESTNAIIEVANDTTQLPLRKLPPIDQAIRFAEAADAELTRLRAEDAPIASVRTAEVTTFGAHHTVRYAKHAAVKPLPERVTAELQALAIGPARIVGVPVELFVELGLAIQDASPGPRPMLIAYANNLLGYVPTKAAFTEGGYEPAVTLLSDRAAESLVCAANALLVELEGRLA